jgi:hypothetical protein
MFEYATGDFAVSFTITVICVTLLCGERDEKTRHPCGRFQTIIRIVPSKFSIFQLKFSISMQFLKFSPLPNPHRPSKTIFRNRRRLQKGSATAKNFLEGDKFNLPVCPSAPCSTRVPLRHIYLGIRQKSANLLSGLFSPIPEISFCNLIFCYELSPRNSQ